MSAFTKRLFQLGNAGHVWLYQRSRGRLGTMGGTVLLLTTTGRKTGKRRTVPLMYLEDGDRYVVTATAGGSDRHPAWYLNLEADPNVEVQIGSEIRPMRASTAPDEERDALYARFVASNRRFADYEQRTERRIPVVILEPR